MSRPVPEEIGLCRQPDKSNDMRYKSVIQAALTIMVCLFIIFCALWVYHPVRYHGATDCDDFYITENPQLQRSAVNLENMVYVMTTVFAGVWMPVSTIFVGAEHILFGSDYGMYHVVCMLLHIANGLILFFLLRMMTGAFWKSALVASLFTLHPLNVEPVAWLVGIRVVLCGFFSLWSIWFYVVYVKRGSTWAYLLSLLAYGVATAVVPMYVLLPFAFFLFDYWPLKRFDFSVRSVRGFSHLLGREGMLRELVWEKMPFFLFIVGMSAIVLASHDLPTVYHYPFVDRLLNVPIAYVQYIKRIFLPVNLSVFYPFPTSFPAWKVGGAVLALACLTAAALWASLRHRFFITGWLWFVGMVAPLTGIAQVGTQAMADHYNYLPMIGILVALAWGVETLVIRHKTLRLLTGFAAVTAVFVFAVLSARQVGVWKDTFTLCKHALAVTSGNYEAHNYLGQAYAKKGNLQMAIYHFSQALAIKPDHVKSHYNIATVYMKLGNMKEAAKHYTLALLADPYSPQAHNNLGMALAGMGDIAGAVKHYRAALELAPNFYQARNNLANALADLGRLDEAVENYRKALSVKPDSPTMLYNLADVLAREGKTCDAVRCLQKALSINPLMAKARLRLADLWMDNNRPDLAASQYLALLSRAPGSAVLHYRAALALRASGDIDQANRHFEMAQKIDPGIEAKHRFRESVSNHGQ